MHRHLFPEQSSSLNPFKQVKLDMLFDSTFYDRYLFGINHKNNEELYQYLNLFTFPFYWIISMLNGEKVKGFFNLYEPSNIYKVMFAEEWTCVLVFCIIGLLFALKHKVQYKYLITSSKEIIFLSDISVYLFFTAFSIIFVDMRTEVSVLDLFGHFLVFCGYAFFFIGSD